MLRSQVLASAINAMELGQWDGVGFITSVEDELGVVIQALSSAGSLTVEEELVRTTQAVALSYRLSNSWWSTLGYNKRPKRGGVFEPFVSETQRAQQDFLFTEIFLMTVVIFCGLRIDFRRDATSKGMIRFANRVVNSMVLRDPGFASAKGFNGPPDIEKYASKAFHTYFDEQVATKSSGRPPLEDVFKRRALRELGFFPTQCKKIDLFALLAHGQIDHLCWGLHLLDVVKDARRTRAD